MKTCSKCGHQFFECTADTFDSVNFTVTIYDDGSINSEESGKEYVGETEWHGNVICWECGVNFDLETWEEIARGEEISPYTVFLLYPDYIADEFGKETYLAHVMAAHSAQAIEKAQQAVLLANPDWDDVDPEDFHVLLTVRGHLSDLTPDRR